MNEQDGPDPGRSALDRLLEPRSIAVVGASDRPGSLGLRTMRNLEDFAGRLLPVSRRLDRIGRNTCYPDVGALPEAPDCAILAVPAAAVEAEVEACAARGVGGCVVFASGYAEIDDPAGRGAQERLAGIARAAGMRLLGPNTTGFANFVSGARAGFAEFPGGIADGQIGIGIVSQSGALGLALAQSAEHGAGISHVLTCGNSADLDIADLVRFLVKQPAAKAIAVAFEGIADPEGLLEAIERATASGKPVTVCRVGRSQAGAAAVRWHTGTDPNADFAWDRRLAEVGATVVGRLETFLETTVFLAKFAHLPRRSQAPAIAILASSGGAGILAADSIDATGLKLAELGRPTLGRLAAELPDFASPRNPCDATAQATSNPAMVTRCAELLLDDDAVDALVLCWSKAWNSGQFGDLAGAARARGKPLCLVWVSQWLEGPGAADAELEPGLALFRSFDSCAAALAGWSANTG